MESFRFTFRARPRGSLGVFDHYASVVVDCERDATIIAVVEQAGALFHERHPDLEPGGIVVASDNANALAQLLNDTNYIH